MVPVGEDPRDGPRVGRRPDRPVRADHAVARGDGRSSRREMERAGLPDPAADRRRDDVAGAHRGEDRAALPRAGRPRASTRRARSASPSALVDRDRRDAFAAGDPRRVRDGPPRARRAAGDARPATRSPRRARHRFAIDWTGPAPSDRRGRRSSASGRSTTHPLDELVGRIDWTPFFATWELRGAYPGDPRRPDAWAPAARDLHADARRDAPADRRRAAAHARRRRSASGRRTRVGDDIELYTSDGRDEPLARRPHAPPADGQAAGPAEPRPGRLHGAARVRRRGLRRRVRGHRRARRRRARRRGSRPPTTTTARSCSRPSPTGWPRRSPSGSTSSSGASCGATRPTSTLPNDATSSASEYQGIRPAPGYPACPDHTEKGTLFELLEAERAGRHPLTESFAMLARRVGQRLLLLAPAGALLRPRPDRAGPARGLRGAQGLSTSRRWPAGSRRTSPTRKRGAKASPAVRRPRPPSPAPSPRSSRSTGCRTPRPRPRGIPA